jgi:tetratricopeptide (TPR) repeat protein
MAFYNRGVAYANLGEYQKAINDYDQAITLVGISKATFTKKYSIVWIKGNSLIVIIDSFLVLA